METKVLRQWGPSDVWVWCLLRREDSNGRPIVELAPGFTEDDVTRYFKKLQTTLENDTRISKDARFSRERNKGF